MSDPLSIALAQTGPSTGDLDGNAAVIEEWCREATGAGADVIVFPELALTGYGADDLFHRADFLAAGERVLTELATRVRGLTALVGYAEPRPAGSGRGPGWPGAADSVAVLAGGSVQARYRKRRLGRDAVNQAALFQPGKADCTLTLEGSTMGILAGGEYDCPELFPAADLIAVCGGTPYVRGSARAREAILREAALKRGAWLALADHAGGQDELIFEGASCLISPEGEVVSRAGQFSEELLICAHQPRPTAFLGDIEELYRALVVGIRDYTLKNGFKRVGLGLSGGLDSALVAALAFDALGPERLSVVIMPSRHSSAGTRSDARELAARLGCESIELPIEGPMAAYETLLGADAEGIAAENLQARTRGNLLMVLSNRRGWLVLSTGNRSEAAVGYCTLYGDMVGGLSPIQDVPKTVAFELCRYRNTIAPLIPESIIERPPSAELSPGQKDSDSLPEYPVLDRLLELYIDRGEGLAGMVAAGFDAETASSVIALVDRSEYKRRQAAPGLRVSRTSFARDRQMPLTNRFRAGATDPG